MWHEVGSEPSSSRRYEICPNADAPLRHGTARRAGVVSTTSISCSLQGGGSPLARGGAEGGAGPDEDTTNDGDRHTPLRARSGSAEKSTCSRCSCKLWVHHTSCTEVLSSQAPR